MNELHNTHNPLIHIQYDKRVSHIYGELQVTALMLGLQFRSTNCRSFRCDLDSRVKDRKIL